MWTPLGSLITVRLRKLLIVLPLRGNYKLLTAPIGGCRIRSRLCTNVRTCRQIEAVRQLVRLLALVVISGMLSTMQGPLNAVDGPKRPWQM